MPQWGWNLISFVFGGGFVFAVVRMWLDRFEKKQEAKKKERETRIVVDVQLMDALVCWAKRTNHGIREFQKWETDPVVEQTIKTVRPCLWWNGMYSEGMDDLIAAEKAKEDYRREQDAKAQVHGK